MAGSNIILEGFTSKNPVLITEGFVDLQELAYSATGTIIISGSSIVVGYTSKTFSASGTILITGEALRELEKQYQAIGELVISGVAEKELGLIYFGSGSIIISGTSEIELAKLNEYLGSGQVIVSGLGSYIGSDFKFETSASGLIYVSGSSSVKVTRFGKILEFLPRPTEIEIDNYEDRFTKPEYANAVRGIIPERQKIIASAYSSKEKISGKAPLTAPSTAYEDIIKQREFIVRSVADSFNIPTQIYEDHFSQSGLTVKERKKLTSSSFTTKKKVKGKIKDKQEPQLDYEQTFKE
jgi:hypothetical protein